MQTFWRNVTNPEVTDWVGVFLLHNSSEQIDPVTHAPTKFQVRQIFQKDNEMKGPKITEIIVGMVVRRQDKDYTNKAIFFSCTFSFLQAS